MTAAELTRPQSVDPSWLRLALGEIGTREIKGPSHHPRIVAYHQTTRLAAKTDETPWCSSFMSWVMIEAGYVSTRSAAASSWSEYGVEAPAIRGAIAVFTRPMGHHVGIVAGVSGDRLWILGGNQSDTVQISLYTRARLLCFRCPDPARARPVDAAWFAQLRANA